MLARGEGGTSPFFPGRRWRGSFPQGWELSPDGGTAVTTGTVALGSPGRKQCVEWRRHLLSMGWELLPSLCFRLPESGAEDTLGQF